MSDGQSDARREMEEGGLTIARRASGSRPAPCSASCAKCGCDDIYRRYYDVGKDTNGPTPKYDFKSTEWVNRSDAWVQPAIKDCIVHVCRCCGYQWDSDPLPNSDYPTGKR